MSNKFFYETDKWREIREEAIRYFGECAQCGATADLVVHHNNYVRFGGNEELEDLVVLCRECHQIHHEAEEDYWVGIVNAIEGIILNKILTESAPDKAKKVMSIEKNMKRLRRILEERKIVQGMDFMVIHSCHRCSNGKEVGRYKYKCKKPGEYGCYPGYV